MDFSGEMFEPRHRAHTMEKGPETAPHLWALHSTQVLSHLIFTDSEYVLMDSVIVLFFGYYLQVGGFSTQVNSIT